MSDVPEPRRARWRLLDAVWLFALSVYIMAGVPLVTFHGDETNQIYGSRDFRTVFLEGQPNTLMVEAPNSTPAAYLRIVHGSVARYSIGFALHLTGLLREDLLPPEGYRWGMRYAENVTNRTRPPDALLTIARVFPALFLAISTWIMFGLGAQFGGRSVAYGASLLYAVNPVILLNGRRALQEGPLLCFGLLTILVAVLISRRRALGEPVTLRWWLALILASALALASKQSAIVYIASAFGWILMGDLMRRRWRDALNTVFRLALTGIAAMLVFWAISPGMWHADPLRRINDVLAIRREQMDTQVRGINGGPATLQERVEAILFQPYRTPASHFEVRSWTRINAMATAVARYDSSPLSGVHFGAIVGGLLTLLAGVGLVVVLVPPLRPSAPAVLYAGLLLWFGINVLVLMANPLPWQRYFLSLIPVSTLLTVLGAWGLVRAGRRLLPVSHHESLAL